MRRYVDGTLTNQWARRQTVNKFGRLLCVKHSTRFLICSVQHVFYNVLSTVYIFDCVKYSNIFYCAEAQNTFSIVLSAVHVF